MREELNCPNCGWRLMDKNKNITTKVKLVKPIDVNIDFSIKCKRCKNEVGIEKT